MGELVREKIGKYTFVHHSDDFPDAISFIQSAMNPGRRLSGGRGGPGLFTFGEKKFVCRQYWHGGLLRGITGGVFPGEDRAAREFEVTTYLEKTGFPVVRAVGYIARRSSLANELFFITAFVENARDIVEYFRSTNARKRLRMARKLAHYFFRLGELGIYHPDLHLRNILVDPADRLFFLDFDKSIRKDTGLNDYERMFWRLDRYVRKYASDFGIPVNDRERLIFLRTFERISGQKIIARMAENNEKKQRSARLGWYVDRLFYKKK